MYAVLWTTNSLEDHGLLTKRSPDDGEVGNGPLIMHRERKWLIEYADYIDGILNRLYTVPVMSSISIT